LFLETSFFLETDAAFGEGAVFLVETVFCG
jgi:hypothetical protein